MAIFPNNGSAAQEKRGLKSRLNPAQMQSLENILTSPEGQFTDTVEPITVAAAEMYSCGQGHCQQLNPINV